MRLQTTIVPSIAVLTLMASPARAQNWGGDFPRDGVCFYEHPNFGGQYFCESVGASRGVPPGANDRISSIRIFGNASVTVFQDVNFRNASMRFDTDQPDLERVGWDDRISSFRIGTRRGGDSGSGWGRPTPPSSGACFYEDPNFRGNYFCASRGSITTQVPESANDRISSIRVFGNASVTVFQDVSFRNASMRFDTDQPNLERVGWDDRISSFRIEARGSGGGKYDYNTEAQWTYPQAQAMVQRAYRSVLGRDPDAGAANWINETVKNHWSQAQLEEALKSTPEYRQKHK